MSKPRNGATGRPSSPGIFSGARSAEDRLSFLRWFGPLLLLLAVCLAWGNSLGAPFELDDRESIAANSTIRDFWSFRWIQPPGKMGETVGGRPVLNLSLALNYAANGLDVRGYRAVNIALHFVSALFLFGVARRLFERSLAPSAPTGVPASPREKERFAWLALAVALLWALHPLQTSAVTYVIQRAEALAALFYLATLYCFLRAVEQPGSEASGAVLPKLSPSFWSVSSVALCMLGAATKETLVTAPFLVFLCDRTFVSGSFREAWRVRRRFYLGLAASWLLLGYLVSENAGRGGSAGWGAKVDSWSYALTQCEAIVRYLGLAVWPSGQVFDYGAHVVRNWESVALQAALLLALAGATLWGLWRRLSVGFIGACFFLLLAPSSSVVSVATQTMAEHRMYLALAAVIAFVLGCLFLLSSRLGKAAFAWLLAAVAGVALAFGALTWRRNAVYGDELSLWRDTVEKWPENPRALNNLGAALLAGGRYDEAASFFRKAVRLQPNHAFALSNLGIALMQSAVSGGDVEGRLAEAEASFKKAIAADPRDAGSRINLGKLLADRGDREAARKLYEEALVLEPTAQDARVNLAALLLAEGRVDEASALLRKALAVRPELSEAHLQYGFLLEKQGKGREAEVEYREAIRLKPALAQAQLALGNLLARRNAPEAEAPLREALRLSPDSAEAWYALGTFLVRQERLADAIEAYRESLRRDATHVQALNNLGNCYLLAGRVREAVDCYESVLRLKPGDASVRQNLDYARELLQNAR